MKDNRNIKVDFFGTEWTVRFVEKGVTMPDSEGKETWVAGRCNYEKRVIDVSTKDSDNEPLPAKEIMITLLHELFHASLVSGQYLNSSGDEPLVEWLARSTVKIIEALNKWNKK